MRRAARRADGTDRRQAWCGSLRWRRWGLRPSRLLTRTDARIASAMAPTGQFYCPCLPVGTHLEVIGAQPFRAAKQEFGGYLGDGRASAPSADRRRIVRRTEFTYGQLDRVLRS